MTRLELLQLVTARARSNGFEFRRWYTTRLGLPWISADAAVTLLDTQRRYYALIFSHEFASAFWKPGSEMAFEVPTQTFERCMPDGSRRVIRRKSFTRRIVRPDVWRYHLGEMAATEEPLRYLRKYLLVEENLDADVELDSLAAVPVRSGKTPAPRSTAQKRAQPQPLPTGMPAFLKRPYPGSKV